MKNKLRKMVALFFSIIMIIAVVNFSLVLNTKEVIAANVDTCGLTNDGNYCVEVASGQGWEQYGGCKSGHEFNFQRKSEVTECQKGVCVPSDLGSCLDNVEKVRCVNEQAGTFHLGASKESVSACQLGCCIQYGSCSVQEEKVCSTDLSAEEFKPGIVNRQKCNLECAGSVVGCYKSAGGGSCEYGPLELFKSESDFNLGNFFGGTLCSEVVGCPSYREKHVYKSCGDGTTDDDKWDVYWYDSDGNREEIFEECRPGGMCDDPDNVVGGEDASCLSTNCVDDSPNTWPNTFKSGESICLNVLSGFFSNDKKSTGLHNYILTCQNREVHPDFDDDNRGKRCEESVSLNSSRVEADWYDNEWEDCSKCGEGRSIIDIFNYAPGVGQFLANVVGKQCGGSGRDWPANEICSDFGDCGGGPLLKDERYDRDIWQPIGSCNALYPPGEGAEGYGDPGNRCNQCGKGGDGAVNVCTQAECNALGDCQFEEGNFGTGLAQTGALAIGTMASGIGVCAVASIFGGFGGWGACSSAVVSAFSPIALSGILYWGLVSIIYGSIIASGTEDKGEVIDDVYSNNGKIKLAYSLSLANHLNKILSEDEKEELASSSNFKEGGETTSHWWGLGANVVTNVLSTVAIPAISNNLYTIIGGEGGFIFKWSAGELEVAEGFWGSNIKYVGKEFLGVSMVTIGKVLGVIGTAATIYGTAKSFHTGECIPEQPYKNSDHCAECGLEGQWYCTENRCNILGGESGWCSYVPYEKDGTISGLCLPSEPDDHSSPYLTSINIEFKDEDDLKIQGPFNGNGRNLDISQKIKWETDHATLKINTSEVDQCKYSFAKSTNYEDMNSFPWDASSNHELNISFSAEDKIRDKTYIYVKCEDVSGNANKEDKDYVSFSFEEAPDELPPIIDYINPVNINVPEGTTDIPFMLYAYDKNGVDNCKYSKDNNTLNYGDMTSFGAKTNVQCSQTDENCQKFTTSFDLTEADWCEEINIPEGTDGITVPFNSTFCSLFIKCADTQNNVMEDPYLWSTMIWPTFEMDIIKPNATFETYDDKFDIEIETENEALCTYEIGNDLYNITKEFTKNHKTTHVDLVGTPSGILYTILYECTDFAGNVVSEERTLTAYTDVDAPILLRVWRTSQQLHVLMDEESVCKYTNDKRDFDFDDIEDIFTMISSRDGKEHYASLGEEAYYIKCRDKWENENLDPFIIYP